MDMYGSHRVLWRLPRLPGSEPGMGLGLTVLQWHGVGVHGAHANIELSSNDAHQQQRTHTTPNTKKTMFPGRTGFKISRFQDFKISRFPGKDRRTSRCSGAARLARRTADAMSGAT